MSSSHRINDFADFFRQAYDAAIVEPLASRFKEFSQAGDRRGMAEIIIDIPCVANTEIAKSYKGKNDEQATKLYKKSMEVITEGSDKSAEESKTCKILTEALFMTSASSLVFLDALLERAKRWCNSGAFARCLKDCKCMLTIPDSFYDGLPNGVSSYLERRKECLHLERECSKRLETLRRRRTRGKGNVARNPSVDASTGKSVTVTPIVHGKVNSYLESCSNVVALRFDEERGRHLVATKDICAGSILIVDRPFSYSTDEEAVDRNCLHCHGSLLLEDNVRIPCRSCQTVSFCTEACREEAWNKYHKYECTILGLFFGNKSKRYQASPLLLAYRMTIAAIFSSINNTKPDCKASIRNTQFFQYHSVKKSTDVNDNNRKEEFVLQNEVYKPLDYKTVLQLETHCVDEDPNLNIVRTIEAVFLAKCLTFTLNKIGINSIEREEFIALTVGTLQHLQAINCNAYEIIENIRDEKTRIWEPRNVGGAIYTTVSLLNHSCYPNVVRHSYPGGKVVVRALRFIEKGNEILDCYGPQFISEEKLKRREYLWKKYHFLCACDACKYNWQFPLLETISFKCKACSKDNRSPVGTDTNLEKNKRCMHCNEKMDYKKLEKLFQKSVEKRLNAVSKMYQGYYREALDLLLDHIDFVEKHLSTPNMEIIKTQQCLIQCYNSFGCISKN